MPIEKPETSFDKLGKEEQSIIKAIALDFMSYKGLTKQIYELVKLPADDVLVAIIDMLNHGLLRIVSKGNVMMLEIYNNHTDEYERI